jgi:hypothetical protein
MDCTAHPLDTLDGRNGVLFCEDHRLRSPIARPKRMQRGSGREDLRLPTGRWIRGSCMHAAQLLSQDGSHMNPEASRHPLEWKDLIADRGGVSEAVLNSTSEPYLGRLWQGLSRCRVGERR